MLTIFLCIIIYIGVVAHRIRCDRQLMNKIIDGKDREIERLAVDNIRYREIYLKGENS